MNNQAVKYFCMSIMTMGILCGGLNVSAQTLMTNDKLAEVVASRKVVNDLYSKGIGLQLVGTADITPIHTDAGVTSCFRIARDGAVVTKHKTDVVQSAGETEENATEEMETDLVAEEVVTDEQSEMNACDVTEENATETPESHEIVKEYPITDGNTTKTVLPYKAFGKHTNQAKLQSLCETNEVGLRVYDGRYTIAVGTYFNMSIGQYFDLELANGTVIPCIMGDLKSDLHTDARGLFTEASGCMTEFIVDQEYLPNKCSATYCYDNWNSKVVNVVVYNKFVNLD